MGSTLQYRIVIDWLHIHCDSIRRHSILQIFANQHQYNARTHTLAIICAFYRDDALMHPYPYIHAGTQLLDVYYCERYTRESVCSVLFFLYILVDTSRSVVLHWMIDRQIDSRGIKEYARFLFRCILWYTTAPFTHMPRLQFNVFMPFLFFFFVFRLSFHYTVDAVMPLCVCVCLTLSVDTVLLLFEHVDDKIIALYNVCTEFIVRIFLWEMHAAMCVWHYVWVCVCRHRI